MPTSRAKKSCATTSSRTVRSSNSTLGYTLRIPSIKSYIRSIRFTFTARNVFCLTKYRGIDPEVNTNGLTPGFEGLEVWPSTRVFTFGITLNL